jgi:hypothetical protein
MAAVIPTRLRADPVTFDVLSETYTVRVGFFLDRFSPPSPLPDVFIVSSTSSSSVYLADLIASVNPPYPFLNPPDPLNQTRAAGQVNGSTALFESVDMIYYGLCSADFVFRPSAPAVLDISATVDRQSDSGSIIELKDLTAGTTLLTLTAPVYGSRSEEFAVDPTHAYELTELAEGTTDTADAIATMTLSGVPDSACTGILLVFAVAGLAGLNWRQRRGSLLRNS